MDTFSILNMVIAAGSTPTAELTSRYPDGSCASFILDIQTVYDNFYAIKKVNYIDSAL